jgi:hypothetical protein
MLIDINKKYTSNHRPVRILCTDRPPEIEYRVVGMRDDGAILYFTENGESASGPTYDLVEIWEPRYGEWCLFCNDLKPHRTVLDQFNKMTDDGKFQSICGTIWNYCNKFDGTLPEYLREDVK